MYKNTEDKSLEIKAELIVSGKTTIEIVSAETGLGQKLD